MPPLLNAGFDKKGREEYAVVSAFVRRFCSSLLAEDELKRLFKVWASVFVALSYCYIVGKLITPKFTRLVAILPIIALFLALPLNLTSFHFCGLTAFFISWLANFKLLLFALGKGPLCSNNNPSNNIISFPNFLALSCLPIKIQEYPLQNNSPKSQINPKSNKKSKNKSYPLHKNSPKSEKPKNPDQNQHNNNDSYPFSRQKYGWIHIIKGVSFALILKIYDYSEHIHPKIIWLIYCFQMYVTLELVLALLAELVKLFLGLELEPQFDEPLLSTSLQDFWSRRWNIMVTKILRPMVYLPTLEFATRVIGRKWAPLTAIMTTFLVSAIMHELLFYYLGRVAPTFEVTWYFLLHGFCLSVEVVVKKSIGRKWWVPGWVSRPVTVAFVVGTGFWFFLPPLVRAGMETKPFQEYAAVAKFVRNLKGVIPF
ncbi:Acyl-CoA--sterol O-acyltransferase 1 [Bienertia sinuspersici]